MCTPICKFQAQVLSAPLGPKLKNCKLGRPYSDHTSKVSPVLGLCPPPLQIYGHVRCIWPVLANPIWPTHIWPTHLANPPGQPIWPTHIWPTLSGQPCLANPIWPTLSGQPIHGRFWPTLDTTHSSIQHPCAALLPNISIHIPYTIYHILSAPHL